jgi:N-acetylneuraminate synthase
MNNISNFKKPFIISEIGSNHNGSIKLAKKLIKLSKDCGCDAVKFQSFDSELFCEEFYNKNPKLKKDVIKYSLSFKQLKSLRKFSKKIGILFGTAVFSTKQFLEAEKINCDFIKIASMDLSNEILIETVVKTKKLLIISTGLSNEKEIINCSKFIKKNKKKNVIFLHCISVYPPKNEKDLNLNYIKRLKKITGFDVGFSDHTIGSEASVIASFLGSVVIEKHFTHNRKSIGWDHNISADPKIMSEIVNTSKNFNKYLGFEKKIISRDEVKVKKIMRRSICVYRDIKKGEKFNKMNLSLQRPGTGIPTKYFKRIIGKTANKKLVAGRQLKFTDY